MQRLIKRYWINILLYVVAFYALPIMANSISDPISSKDLYVMSLIVIQPLLVLIISLVDAKRSGFSLVTIALPGVLIIPAVYIFYNDSALFYVGFYAVLAAVGSGVGAVGCKS